MYIPSCMHTLVLTLKAAAFFKKFIAGRIVTAVVVGGVVAVPVVVAATIRWIDRYNKKALKM
jgi:uncharacterized membrane protein (DUF485 family)